MNAKYYTTQAARSFFHPFIFYPMKLSAPPFHPTTGALLPVYRDAYLRGDLTRQSAGAVDAYLRQHEQHAEATLRRWYELNAANEAPTQRAPGFVSRQLAYIRQSPQRFRQRAATFLVGTALLAGAASAHTILNRTPLEGAGTGEAPAAPATGATKTFEGRIVDAKGRPLVGATVLLKGSRLGVGTDANGCYTLHIPASTEAPELLYGYAGYDDVRLAAPEAATAGTVALAPSAHKKHRWLFF